MILSRMKSTAPSAIRRRKSLSGNPIPWIAPMYAVLIVMFLFPIIEIIRLSFTNSTLTSDTFRYTLDSYRYLLEDMLFWKSIGITLVFVFFSVIFQVLLGFIVSYSVVSGENRNMRGTSVVRAVSLFSLVIPGAIIGIIWKMIFSEAPSGLLNYALSSLGFGKIAFLTNSTAALVSVIIANVWRGTAQCTILIYSGLKTVSTDVVEASRVDGANWFQRILYVILPTLRPILMINLLLSTIGTFNTFDMIMSLTKGGPGSATQVMSLSVYNRVFQLYDLGKGAANAVLLLLLNVAMAAVYYAYMKRSEQK